MCDGPPARLVQLGIRAEVLLELNVMSVDYVALLTYSVT
jgi:hypothetical protein